MDNSLKYTNPNPYPNTNLISKLVFWWLVPLFRYGKNHDLEVKDLYNVLPNDSSNLLGDNLEKNWKTEYEEALKSGRKPKLLRAIRKTFLPSYLRYGAWLFFQYMILRIAQPLILGLLIWHFDPRSESTTGEAYLYASGVVFLSIFIALVQHHSNLGQQEIGMRLRVACSSLVYRKILRLSRSASDVIAGGRIINLLSNDVARFDQLFLHLHFAWIMPLQGTLVAYLIWRNVGIASLAGIFLIALQTIPLQGYLGKLTSRLRMKVALKTDERIRLMNEIISGIKVIKMYTWEKPFLRLVTVARKYEIDVLTLTSYLRGFNKATFVFTERTTLFFTVLTYVLTGNDISAAKVFTVAQYFNLVQLIMAIYYPMAVSAAAEALVSISRLQTFLLLEENRKILWDSSRRRDAGITVKEVTANWQENSIANTLHDITILFEPEKLSVIIGPVGAGKSSILQLILGELEHSQGQVSRGGIISYASQEPWLFSGSVRNNIIFGSPYDEARYRRVTEACALLTDFSQLPRGDRTLVGEKGCSLSGGQRARINLARAVYAEADIYLFDDPLSAVDPRVGKEIFQKCFLDFLKTKTRILITHQVQFLKLAQHIIFVNNGVVTKQGTFEEFREEDLNFIKSANNEDEEKEENEEEKNVDEEISIKESSSAVDNENDKDETEPRESEELVAKGRVLKSLYWQYFSAGNSISFILLFLLVGILGQLGSSGTDFWVAHWANEEELRVRKILTGNASILNDDFGINRTESNFTLNSAGEAILERDTALSIYGIFIIASVIFTSARNLIFFKLCMNSNKNLHNSMFASLSKAPMKFFDENPSGRILNRFSKDVGSIDEVLPMTMIDSIQIFFVAFGILAQVVIINWWTIFPILIMSLLYGEIRKLYLSTASDVKRLEGISKSPVFSHVNATVSGLATIRSSGKEEILKKEFDSYQDVHTGAYYLSIATSTAFGLWIDAVTILFVAFVTYSFVFLDDESTFSGNVGLAISQILILCGMLQHGMRQTAETVAQMTSVERILQFRDLESEGPMESDVASKPETAWPKRGEIKFENVSLSYKPEEPPVLKNISFLVESGSKVGIVGRTGAGKSSIINVLFNLTKYEGKVWIDGIDVKKIGLCDLRSKISIIPQEPVLFSSSLRENLDPFGEYPDEKIWSALEQVRLKNNVSTLGLAVSRGGSNFSVGQRQLLCLARAVLRNNKILVLDEATANVDPLTDRLVQQTIRNNFASCTVLTIAHRFNTVMDSDKILVLEEGRLLEYDEPRVLLLKPEGIFKNMLRRSGNREPAPLGSENSAEPAKEAIQRRSP